MATKIQGITIEIGGDTSPLASALSSLNKTINSTQSELKNVDKALKLNPESTVLLTQKHKLLEDQIINTSQKVAKLRDVEKELQKRRDADPSNKDLEQQLRAVQRELSNTEIGLGKLKAEYTNNIKTAKEYGTKLDDNINKHKTFKERLSDVIKGFKNFVTGSREAGDSAKSSATELNAATEIWNKFSGAVSNAAKKVFDFITGAASKADDLNTLAAKTGLSTEELQKMEYAAHFVDVEVETMTGSMAKLVNNMDNARKGSGAAYEAFSRLGIKITDNNGELRNSNEVYYEVIDALGKVYNATERDALAMDIFGKSAQDLNPLIKAGSEQLRAYGAEAEAAGIIMSQETLDGANQFHDSLERLKLMLEGAATSAAALAAGGLTDLLEALMPIFLMIVQMIALLGKIPTPVIYIIGIIITLVATFAKVTSTVSSVTGVIKMMNPEMWKTVGIIMAIITALIILIALIVTLTGKTKDLGQVGQSIGQISGQVGNIDASGNIPRYANGTNYHRGGAAFITEYAPEQLSLPNGTNMVVMPRGTKVDPNVTIGAGGGDVFNISINAKDVQDINDIVDLAHRARQDRRAR